MSQIKVLLRSFVEDFIFSYRTRLTSRRLPASIEASFGGSQDGVGKTANGFQCAIGGAAKYLKPDHSRTAGSKSGPSSGCGGDRRRLPVATSNQSQLKISCLTSDSLSPRHRHSRTFWTHLRSVLSPAEVVSASKLAGV